MSKTADPRLIKMVSEEIQNAIEVSEIAKNSPLLVALISLVVVAMLLSSFSLIENMNKEKQNHSNKEKKKDLKEKLLKS